MEFDYLIQTVVGDTLDVDDLGNCAIQAFNDKGEEYYLIIKTVLGWSEIFEFGPTISDKSTLEDTVFFSYRKVEFAQPKLQKVIDKFLNNPRYFITQAFCMEIEEAKTHLRNIADYV